VDMMLDILLTNRAAVLDWIDAFAYDLAGLRETLSAEDEAGLPSLARPDGSVPESSCCLLVILLT